MMNMRNATCMETEVAFVSSFDWSGYSVDSLCCGLRFVFWKYTFSNQGLLECVKSILINGKWQYIFIALLIKTFEVIVTSVVSFLIAYLVSEILKDK